MPAVSRLWPSDDNDVYGQRQRGPEEKYGSKDNEDMTKIVMRITMKSLPKATRPWKKVFYTQWPKDNDNDNDVVYGHGDGDGDSTALPCRLFGCVYK